MAWTAYPILITAAAKMASRQLLCYICAAFVEIQHGHLRIHKSRLYSESIAKLIVFVLLRHMEELSR